MILNEKQLPGEEEVTKEKAAKLEAAKTHDVRKDAEDGKWYAKKKVTSDKRKGEEEVTKEKAAKLDAAKTHDVRQGSDGKWYAKKKVAEPPSEFGSEETDEKPYLKVKLPFKTTAESDAFRAWLLSKFPNYGNESAMSKTLVISKPHSDYKTSEALKNAYYEKGEMYKKWVADGGKVDPKTFVVTDPSVQVIDGGNNTVVDPNIDLELQSKVIMKGCQSIGVSTRFYDLAQETAALNDLVKDFINWWKNATGKTLFIPRGTCGFDPLDDNWEDRVYYDEKGDKYAAWQSSIINDLANETRKTADGQTTTLFDMWLKNREERMKKNRLKAAELGQSGLNTPSLPQVQTTQKDLSDIEYAALSVIQSGVNRKTCNNLKYYMSDYNVPIDRVDKAIARCRAEYPRLMKESLQDKITSKLKMMKENKTQNNVLNEKVTEKLKMKKLEKISENFFKQNYRKFFDSYSQYMKSNKMISEASNAEFEKSFNTIFKGKEEEFKKRAIDYVITKLEVNPTSPLATEIRNELSKKSAKELFTNEYDIPDAVTTAIEKTNQQSSSDDTGLKGIVSKSVKIDDKQVKQEVRKHLEKYVDEVKTNISSLEQKIKTAVVQGI